PEYREMRHHYEHLSIQLPSQRINVDSAVRFTNLTEEELLAAPEENLPKQTQPVYAIQTEERNPFTGREPDLILAPHDPRRPSTQLPDSLSSPFEVISSETPDSANITIPNQNPAPIHYDPITNKFAFDFLILDHA